MADADFGIDDDGEVASEFQAAADHLAAAVSAGSKAYNDAAKLKLYGLYKQATVGHCTGSRPSFWNPAAQAKWDAWHRCGDLPKEAAMAQYVVHLTSLTPDWNAAERGEQARSAGGKKRGGGGGGGIGGPVFSSLAGHDAATSYAREDGSSEAGPRTLHELAGEGDLDAVSAALRGDGAAGRRPVDVNERDAAGCTALHFAADRGVGDEVLRALLAAGADVGARDEDGSTPLHYAALCGHERVCRLLLAEGADPRAEDAEGQRAQAAAPAEWTFWPTDCS